MATQQSRPDTWYGKVLALCFVIFCFEVGVFLIVFPWLDYWDSNSLTTFSPWLADIWGNPYFRGALSGLGFANVYISFLEVLRLVRNQPVAGTGESANSRAAGMPQADQLK